MARPLRPARILRPRAAAGLLLAASLGAAGVANAQELVHHAQGIEEQLSQTLGFSDPWGESAGEAFFSARPLDVETRVVRTSGLHESVKLELLLQGEWGWFHFPYTESEIDRGAPEAAGLRTERLALDVDADGQNEILLVARRVATRLPTGEDGDPLPGARPRYAEHAVSIRVLDRADGALIESDLVPDPESRGFALLLEREQSGAVQAALQLLAGDWLFREERYPEARYRYQVAREWAERRLSGRMVAELAIDMALLEPDPDLPEFTWITATKRHAALPPFFRRRF